MLSVAELKAFVRQAAAMLSREHDLAEFEVYAAASANRIARLSYTSDIPCRGVEEIKSLGADGFQVRMVMKRNPNEIGTASEAGDFSRDAVRRAIERARHAAIIDPHFPGLPRDSKKLPGTPAGNQLARAADSLLTACAWQTIGGALDAFKKDPRSKSPQPGLVIGGDVSIIHDRIAIVGSNLSGIRTDESSHFMSSITALVESLDSKGTDSSIGNTATEMRRAASALGRTAVKRALGMGVNVRPVSGRYRVVLGPQPIAEILNYMVIGSITTGSFYAASSAYQGRFGQVVMDRRLSLFDDPSFRGGPVRRSITCEGLKSAKTDLIREGRLVGLLSSVYDSHRLETDEARGEKLGAAGVDVKFSPRAGYRMGEGGGRRFDVEPGAAGTNVVLKGEGVSDDRLINAIGNGIYIGRIWYTYPINGQRAGDFTCTITGDSWLIRDGKMPSALAPNCLRINANIAQIFDRPIAIGSRLTPTLVWGASETYFVPAIAIDNIALAQISLPVS